MNYNRIFCNEHPDASLIEDYHAGDQICSECGKVVGDRYLSFQRCRGVHNFTSHGRLAGSPHMIPLDSQKLRLKITIISVLIVQRISDYLTLYVLRRISLFSRKSCQYFKLFFQCTACFFQSNRRRNRMAYFWRQTGRGSISCRCL